jgi:hypothetical protein
MIFFVLIFLLPPATHFWPVFFAFVAFLGFSTLVVYANSITRTEHDDKTGEDVEREIPT